MTPGRSLELYFVDGKPDGMLTAEVFNWTGHVLRIPRTRLADGLRRGEAGQTGIYLLLGQDQNGPLAYIGEAEDMARRIGQHAREKDWWEVAVLVTTTGDALHKAHVKYLESRLITTARAAAAMRLENGNQPSGASLNEAVTANMESFLDTLHMVLPAIRVDVFDTSARPADDAERESAGQPAATIDIHDPSKHIMAVAHLVDGAFILQAGAKMRRRESLPKSAARLADRRKALEEIHDIQKRPEYDELMRNHAFTSPSGASDFVLGAATSGPKEWKLPDGRSYADWEADQLEGAAP